MKLGLAYFLMGFSMAYVYGETLTGGQVIIMEIAAIVLLVSHYWTKSTKEDLSNGDRSNSTRNQNTP